jgi:hypothetical protein
MLRTAAKVFGIVFLVIGVLGFVPGITTDDHLLGIFHVNAAHNIIHLLSGAAALWASSTSTLASRRYFQIFGIVYALVALLGMFYGDEPLLGFIAHNGADVILHVLIAAASLWLGFGVRDKDAAPSA